MQCGLGAEKDRVPKDAWGMPGAGATERSLCGEGSVPVARRECGEDRLGGQGMLRGGGRGEKGELRLLLHRL